MNTEANMDLVFDEVMEEFLSMDRDTFLANLAEYKKDGLYSVLNDIAIESSPVQHLYINSNMVAGGASCQPLVSSLDLILKDYFVTSQVFHASTWSGKLWAKEETSWQAWEDPFSGSLQMYSQGFVSTSQLVSGTNVRCSLDTTDQQASYTFGSCDSIEYGLAA